MCQIQYYRGRPVHHFTVRLREVEVTETVKKCNICREEVEETCGDGNCRACHVSVPWDDCVDGTWTANVLLNKLGRTEEQVRAEYPNHRAVKKPEPEERS